MIGSGRSLSFFIVKYKAMTNKLFGFSLLTVIMPYYGYYEMVHYLLNRLSKDTRHLIQNDPYLQLSIKQQCKQLEYYIKTEQFDYIIPFIKRMFEQQQITVKQSEDETRTTITFSAKFAQMMNYK
jgi:hypothetical protein